MDHDPLAEARLYYGMAWRGAAAGVAAYAPVFIPPSPGVRWDGLAIATLVFALLIALLAAGSRRTRTGVVDRPYYIAQNLVANAAVVLGMWSIDAHEASLAPLLSLILLYNTAFGTWPLLVWTWVVGVSCHFAGSLLSGADLRWTISATIIFGAAGGAAQLAVDHLVGHSRTLVRQIGGEREIAAQAARDADVGTALNAILPRAVDVLGARTVAVMLGSDDGWEMLAGVDADGLVPLIDQVTPHGVVVGSLNGHSVLLCVDAAGEMDARSLRFVGDMVGVVVERAGFVTQLRHQAEVDGLTGLANRRHLDLTLDQLTRRGTPFALMLLDLDHFKELNDHEGHPAGDDVLRRCGALLATISRRGDVAARFGGEEFCLVMVGAANAEADMLSQRLGAAWAREEMPVTFSAGIAAYRPGEPSASVIARADAALYAAKRAGRARVVFEDAPPRPLASDQRAGLA